MRIIELCQHAIYPKAEFTSSRSGRQKHHNHLHQAANSNQLSAKQQAASSKENQSSISKHEANNKQMGRMESSEYRGIMTQDQEYSSKIKHGVKQSCMNGPRRVRPKLNMESNDHEKMGRGVSDHKQFTPVAIDFVRLANIFWKGQFPHTLGLRVGPQQGKPTRGTEKSKERRQKINTW